MFLRTESAGAARFAVTDRYGGVSDPPYDSLNLGGHVGDRPDAVTENRRRVAGQVGVDPRQLLFMRQTHGTGVAVVDRPWRDQEVLPAVDALVTDRPGLALAVLVADCTPVLLANHRPDVVAVAHAGRRGMAAGIVTETIAAMRGLGARPSRIVAFVGPSICGQCYEVPAAMQAEVAVIEPVAASTTRTGTPGLDVRAGVVAQLLAAGVESVEVDPQCTAEAAALYSYRRDQVTGRFAGLAWLPA